jgi:hypothetical protein
MPDVFERLRSSVIFFRQCVVVRDDTDPAKKDEEERSRRGDNTHTHITPRTDRPRRKEDRPARLNDFEAKRTETDGSFTSAEASQVSSTQKNDGSRFADGGRSMTDE